MSLMKLISDANALLKISRRVVDYTYNPETDPGHKMWSSLMLEDIVERCEGSTDD